MNNFTKQIEPIIKELSLAIIEQPLGRKPDYSNEAFFHCVNIFTSALLDKMFSLQEKEKQSIEYRANQAQFVGEKLREFIKIHTNIDTHILAKQIYENL
jgi:hypothetical protein